MYFELIGYHEFNVSCSLNLLTACVCASIFSQRQLKYSSVPYTKEESLQSSTCIWPTTKAYTFSELPEGADYCIMEEDLADIITG